MGINALTMSGSISSKESPWEKLADLYAQAKALWLDLQIHPENKLQDLDQMIALAQQMVALSDQMPTPPSAPAFHKDFRTFLSDLEELKASFVGQVANNPAIQQEEIAILMRFGNLFYDINQGLPSQDGNGLKADVVARGEDVADASGLSEKWLAPLNVM